MSANRDNERTVQVYRGTNPLEVEAISQELRAAGITCSIEGGQLAATFAGFTALDGVTLLSVVVFEPDAVRAHDIAARWLNEQSSDEDADGG